MKTKVFIVLFLTIGLLPICQVFSQDKLGIYVHQIAVHPQKPQVIYASTDNQGVLKSTDGGKTWTLANQGIKAYLLYHILIHPKKHETLYVGSWGGGIYKSTNAGAAWSEMNRGLNDTAIWSFVLDPHDPETLYLATSAGVYKGTRGGENWISISQGLLLGDKEFVQCFIAKPSNPTTLYLGTNLGIYQWAGAETQWTKISGDASWNVTAVAYDQRTRFLYASVAGEGVYRRDAEGQGWQLIADLKNTWARRIVLDPKRPDTFYALTQARGILKKVGESQSWIEINKGIEDTWVTALTFDPKDSKVLYAGTHERGIYKSDNEGEGWVSLLEFEIQDPKVRGEALLPKGESKQSRNIPPAPQSFKKCNECHGWTDPILNSKPSTYWRMAGNRRDWIGTVKKMSRRAQLLPEEEAEIIQYLNTYYGIRKIK